MALPASTALGEALAGGRVDELAEDLVRCVQDAQAQFRRERDAAFLEFEAGRIQLHTEYSQRLFETDKELQGLHEERCTLHDMDKQEVRQNDVVMLNVGGQQYTVKRETLCLVEGSFLAELFSGRWERSLQRDSSNRIFLDLDPGAFEALLGWLRDKKIETPERPVPPPNVSREDLPHFQAMVDYLGLRPHMELSGMGPDGWALANAPRALPSMAALLRKREAPAANEAASASAPEAPAGFLEAAGSFLASWRGRGGGAGAVAEVPVAPGKPVAWSQRFCHASARRGEGPEGAATVAIEDTRPQAAAAAVRGTRGYQSGFHFWEVQVMVLSDVSYVGLVHSDWAALHVPVGMSPGSWSVASNGAILAEGEEVNRLPRGFGEGSVLGFQLELGTDDRTATVFLDGERHENLFYNLPNTVFPAVSNHRAPAQYLLRSDAAPPEPPDPEPPAAGAPRA